jgi:hypothetical protein
MSEAGRRERTTNQVAGHDDQFERSDSVRDN